MSDLTQDLRTKLDDETHRLFDVFTRARGESMAERMRLLILDFNASESHAHTLRTRLLRSEGVEREPKGSGD